MSRTKYNVKSRLLYVLATDIPLLGLLVFKREATVSLVQARLLFPKHPFHTKDIKNRAALGPMVQVLCKKLKRCHIDSMPEINNNACRKALLAGHTVADMLEHDYLVDGRETVELWTIQGQYSFQEHGLNSVNIQQEEGADSFLATLDLLWKDIGGSTY